MNVSHNKKKVLFITGTRADYGKIKTLISIVDESDEFEAFVYVSGMHLIQRYGNTYEEVLKDGYKNIHVAFGLINTRSMSYDLGNVICNLTGYITSIKPDMIVVHGDRIDALAGAIVGALNNIIVSHIEGGELSGSIDESIRHAVSKFSHLHFVSNEEANNRLIQLGEDSNKIFTIGSPDIDIMISKKLPSLDEAKARYEINFDRFSILMYHPVTTDIFSTGIAIRNLLSAALDTRKNYIVIYPNNDLGSEIIIDEYNQIRDNPYFSIFPSVRFEYFLTFLKNADFIIGNSSAGVREACIYGVPTIDIGNRQAERYTLEKSKNIQHVEAKKQEIISAIYNAELYKQESSIFGDGKSTQRFIKILKSEHIWEIELQKKFIDWVR